MPVLMQVSRLRPYLVAFVSPLFVAGIMKLSWPFFEHSPVALFLIAVTVSAWYGGLMPAILSMLFSLLLADYFFIQPYFTFSPKGNVDLVSLVTLLTVGSIISLVSELLHRARERAVSAGLTAAQLAAIVESSSDSIISKDLNGIVQTWNAGAAAMFGYRSEEMIDQSITLIIPTDRLDEEENILERIRRGERVEHFETQRIRKNGTLIDVSVTVSPITDSAGRVVGASKVARDISARKKAERARRTSEARYNALFDYAPDGILIADFDSYYLDANPAICRMLGYPREELIGLHGSDIVAPAEVAHIDNALAEIKTETGHYRQWMFKRKDGTTFLAEVMATSMPDGNLLAVIRDITDRNQAERALRESEEQLRLAVEATKLGTWQLDLRTRERKWSERSKELFHLPPSVELTDELVQSLVHPEDRVWLEKAIPRALEPESGGELHNEFRINIPGHVEANWIESQGHVLYENNEPARMIGTMLDITDRKRAELALKTEKQLLRTLIDMLPDYIYLKDFDSKFLACNEACARLMGQKSPADLVGRTDAEFYPPALAQQFREDEIRVLNGTPLLNKEEVFLRPDGVTELLLTTKLPITNSEGKITGLVGYGRSITAERKAEAEIRKLNDELEERVQERTAQLQIAVKELEAFSYSVSHDLRAPLRHINGFGKALLEDYGDQLDDQAHYYLREMRGASNQMAQLIDDVLDLARVSRTEMHQENVNLTELAQTVFSDLRKTDRGRNVVFHVTEGMEAIGDKRLLRIVMTNLLGNAWKFTSKKENAEITFGQVIRDGEMVYFVRDNGAGFDMKYVNKLFGVFQRLHSAMEFEGTGIGLATIQRIAQRHGGTVWAEGVVNEGATFWFTLG
ncbi:MAG TPA: PAS domain S-box protein [Pyrinomonadaceae bacterium]